MGSLASSKFPQNCLLIKRVILEWALHLEGPQDSTDSRLPGQQPGEHSVGTEAGCVPLAFLAEKIEKSLANDLCKYGDFLMREISF